MDHQNQEDLTLLRDVKKNLEACILGKSREITLLLTALLANGHVLLEDVPGTGKTILIKALARSIQGQFRRIQCNPDLLPGDITGMSIYHPKEEAFVFRPGPVMTHILLADEINRATTKTQSALLEAMEERHVTVDGETRILPKPFFLIATQNPVEFEGTYVLPEAQLDRFLMKFSLGYPDEASEKRMLYAKSSEEILETLKQVLDTDSILRIQKRVQQVYMQDSVGTYLLTIVRKTREHPSVYLGASPRAALAVMQAAKAYAYLQERDYVLPDDIKYLVPYVLSHRIVLHPEAGLEGHTAQTILSSILQQVKVPVGLEKG